MTKAISGAASLGTTIGLMLSDLRLDDGLVGSLIVFGHRCVARHRPEQRRLGPAEVIQNAVHGPDVLVPVLVLRDDLVARSLRPQTDDLERTAALGEGLAQIGRLQTVPGGVLREV